MQPCVHDSQSERKRKSACVSVCVCRVSCVSAAVKLYTTKNGHFKWDSRCPSLRYAAIPVRHSLPRCRCRAISHSPMAAIATHTARVLDGRALQRDMLCGVRQRASAFAERCGRVRVHATAPVCAVHALLLAWPARHLRCLPTGAAAVPGCGGRGVRRCVRPGRPERVCGVRLGLSCACCFLG